MGGCKFKRPTKSITSRTQLESYIGRIASIIEQEKLAKDPDMADFDIDYDENSVEILCPEALMENGSVTD